MNKSAFECPSCGAALALANRFSKVVICQYCDQTSYVDTGGLSPKGRSGKLIESFSILFVGASGTLEGKRFRVLGRLRYEYYGGFWDEWFLEMEEGKFLWLQEDEGTFVAFQKKQIDSELPDISQFSVGTSLELGGRRIFITEKLEATIVGGEGELFFRVLPGQNVSCIDGNSSGSQVAIEITPNEIELCIGREVSIDDLILDEEG